MVAFAFRFFLAGSLVLPASIPAQAITATLLGTGHPEPAMDRFGPATLIEARGQRLLFDAGRGATQRIWELATPIGEIKHVFLTHLHSDHSVGLPDLWLTGSLRNAFGRRGSPLHVYGPAGTNAMVRLLRQAYNEDVRQRNEVADSAVEIIGHDVQEGIVYNQDGVKVTAFTVDHGNPPILALGYRIDHASKSVVVSGDTRRSDNLIRFAQGVDVLIHEVLAAGPGAQAAPAMSRVINSHTSPEEAADVFTRVKPKLAVFTHVSIVSAPDRREAILDGIISRVRSVYSGPLVIGEDRMTIVIGDSVEVRRQPGRR